MAVTCLDLITSAMRELGVLPIGRTPKAAEAAEGLRALQGIADGMAGSLIGGTLADVDVTGDIDLDSNTANYVSAASTITLTFPETPNNGDRIQIKDMLGNFGTYNVTLDGNGRFIDGLASTILNTNNFDTTWIYLADDASWTSVVTLALNSDCPLHEQEFFTLALAKRLAGVYGVQFPDTSETALMRAAWRMREKFQTPPPDKQADYF